MDQGSPEVKDIVIFDLDGTLALIEHRRHHISGKEKDWKAFYEACDQDDPFEAVIAMLRALRHCGYKIWIVSGREDSVRRKTIEWLERHHIEYENLLMRPEGDYTPDTKLKVRWATDGTIPMERVLCVYEDRAGVVDIWRNDLKVPCFQVAPGDF